jgi:hypothetical protein
VLSCLLRGSPTPRVPGDTQHVGPRKGHPGDQAHPPLMQLRRVLLPPLGMALAQKVKLEVRRDASIAETCNRET